MRNMKNQSDSRPVFRPLSELNVIDNFLFTTLSTNEEVNEEFFRILLTTFLQKEFGTIKVVPQKIFSGIDTGMHGIRVDLYIEVKEDDEKPDVTIVDIEAENRPSDKKELPRRNRYYSGIMDVQNLTSGADYTKMQNLITLTILSYDPFGLGEMWYEARTMLTTHPDYPYDDGIRRLFLYADGKINEEVLQPYGITNGENIRDMLQYICYSKKENVKNDKIERVNAIVEKVKLRKEVSVSYMKYWEYEAGVREDARAEGLAEGRAEGLAEGRAEGHTVGREEFREDALRLFRSLKEQNRLDEFDSALQSDDRLRLLLGEQAP